MRRLIVLPAVVLLVACGDVPADDESLTLNNSPVEVVTPDFLTESSDNYDEAYAGALVAMQEATERGHAWSTSRKLIKRAIEAAGNGDEVLAISLADEARIHAQLAVIQADREALAWQDSVISE